MVFITQKDIKYALEYRYDISGDLLLDLARRRLHAVPAELAQPVAVVATHRLEVALECPTQRGGHHSAQAPLRRPDSLRYLP